MESCTQRSLPVKDRQLFLPFDDEPFPELAFQPPAENEIDDKDKPQHGGPTHAQWAEAIRRHREQSDDPPF